MDWGGVGPTALASSTWALAEFRSLEGGGAGLASASCRGQGVLQGPSAFSINLVACPPPQFPFSPGRTRASEVGSPEELSASKAEEGVRHCHLHRFALQTGRRGQLVPAPRTRAT